jgi:hypothetical protein
MSQIEALGPDMNRIQRIALIVGAVALVLCAVGAFLSPAAFFQAYLMGFLYWLSYPLGALGIVALYHLGGGKWGFPIRRPLEAAMMTLPLFAVLFVPLIFGWTTLYAWARPADVAADPILQHKSLYLNVPFALVRAALYFVLWSLVALLLYRTSIEQDRTGDPDLPRLLGRRSRFGLVFVILALSFSAIDWAMSLDPHWFSTIYGMLFLSADGLTGVAFAVIILWLLAQRPPTSDVTTPQTFNDLGNLMLAWVMIWTYMNLSQYLIIWIGNLPEEVPWYLRRSEGGWWWLTLFLFVFQFVLPFCVLLARNNKAKRERLALLAGLILVVRLVDMFWIVMPEVRRDGLAFSWLDIVAPIGIGGIWIAAYIWSLRRQPLLPVHDHRDPRLQPGGHDHAPASPPAPRKAQA